MIKDCKVRVTIIELHKSGRKNLDIAKATGFGRKKVYRAVKCFQETVGTLDRP